MRLTDAQIEMMKEDMVSDIVAIVMTKRHCSMTEAMSIVYNSDTFQRLQETETGLYYQSPGYVEDFLEKELTLGKIC